MTGFSFRWGVDLFDDQRTPIPNWILEYYHQVEWQGVDGDGQPARGVGISNTEMMFIIHLASFKYESEKGVASPSLTGTIAQRMQYRSNQGIINVEKGLVNKGLLLVEKRSGKTSVYDFTPFSQAIIKAIESSTKVDDSDNDPSTKLDDYPSTKVDDSDNDPSTKLDGSRQQNLTRRKEKKESYNKEGEEKKEMNGFDDLFSDKHDPMAGLTQATDGHQRAVDEANGGGEEDAARFIAEHHYWGFMEGPVPLPDGKEFKKWHETGKRILKRLPPPWDLEQIGVAMDMVWHAGWDEFYERMPCKDEALDLFVAQVVKRLMTKSELVSNHILPNLTGSLEPDPLDALRASFWAGMTMTTSLKKAHFGDVIGTENGHLLVRVTEDTLSWIKAKPRLLEIAQDAAQNIGYEMKLVDSVTVVDELSQNA